MVVIWNGSRQVRTITADAPQLAPEGLMTHMRLERLGAEFGPLVRPTEAFGLSIWDIVNAVVEEFGLDKQELLGPRRPARLARPRQLVMMLARDLCKNMSYPRLGQILKRDHTTVMHGADKAASLVSRDPQFRAHYLSILSMLGRSA